MFTDAFLQSSLLFSGSGWVAKNDSSRGVCIAPGHTLKLKQGLTDYWVKGAVFQLFSGREQVNEYIKTTVELVQSDTWVFWNPMTSDKNVGPKVFILTKIKPDILYNLKHFPDPLVCRIRQVSLYIEMREGMFQAGARLLSPAAKVWRDA